MRAGQSLPQLSAHKQSHIYDPTTADSRARKHTCTLGYPAVIILRRCFVGLEQYGQKYIEIIFSNPNYCLSHPDTGLLGVNQNSQNMQFLAIQAYHRRVYDNSHAQKC
jgi:hypothetical protein